MRLTAHHKRRLSEICREWRDICISSEPANFDVLSSTIKAMYGMPEIKAYGCASEPRLVCCSSFNDFFKDIFSDFSNGIDLKESTARKDFRAQFNVYFQHELYLIEHQLACIDGFRAMLQAVGLFSRFSQLRRACMQWQPNYSFRSFDCIDVERYAIAYIGIEFGLEYSDYLKEMLAYRAAIARNAFLWYPTLDRVLFLNRPVSKWDDQNRLHCEDGPAIVFPDCQSYYWHGVHVPEDVVMSPGAQSYDTIHDESNVEIRRIRIERFGWLKYLRRVRATVLDSRKNDVEGTTESLMQSWEGRVLVCACPSTGRVYALPVPFGIETCQQAQIWLSGGLSKRITTAT